MEDKEKLNAFIENYLYLYNKMDRSFLNRFLLKSINDEELQNLDIISQIYYFLGITPKKKSVDYQYAQFLLNNFDNIINSQILEVACGALPILAKILSEEIEKRAGTGKITAVDPTLIFESAANINLERKEFTSNTNVDNFDILIAKQSCDITKDILENAMKNEKDLSILMCGCNPYYDKFDNWLWYLRGYIKAQKPDSLEYEETSLKTIDYPYPVLTLKRK